MCSSDLHVHLSVVAGTVFAYDAGTPSGTFLSAGGGSWGRITANEPTVVAPGSSLRIGSEVFTFHPGQ